MSRKEDKPRKLSELSDEELMTAYVRGDCCAFDELYNRYSRKVYGFLTKSVKDKAIADDLFQTTFLKLHQFRDRYDTSLPFLPWLFTICRNAMLDSVRRREAIREDAIADVAAHPEYAMNEDTSSFEPELVSMLTKNLGHREQEVISLRYSYELSFDEIAKRLKIKAPNARKIAERAIKKLRDKWKTK